MLFFLYSALIVCYFLNLFIDAGWLNYSLGILAFLSWIFSFSGAKGLFKIAGAIFFAIGMGLYMLEEKPFYELPLYMTSTVMLIALFYVLPFINSIIVVGRFDQNVSKLLKSQVHHMGQLYYRGSLVTYLLGTFLNIATLPLVDSVLEKNLKAQAKQLKNIFISRTMLRAYALSLVWSPMEIMVAISVDITKVSYLMILPWLLLFSLVLLFIDWVIGWSFRAHPLDGGNDNRQKADLHILWNIALLFLYLAVFIAAILGVSKMFQLGFIAAVSLVIIPYSFLWALTLKRIRSFIAYSIPVWKSRVLTLQNFSVLFLAVGFFTKILNETSLNGFIQEPISHLTGTPILLFIIIQILFLAMAMIGFHPLITISVLGGILHPMMNLFDPVSLAIVLVTSSMSTVMSGPFNITVTLTGTLLHENPYQVSWWNIRYALLFSSIGTLLAWMLMNIHAT